MEEEIYNKNYVEELDERVKMDNVKKEELKKDLWIMWGLGFISGIGILIILIGLEII